MRFIKYTEPELGVKLDLKDKRILYSLSENARMPYSQIAKKVQLSKDTVKYRIKRLEKNGVIQGYVSVIDISKLGYSTYHIFLRLSRTKKETTKNLIKILKSYPFVKVVIEFSGKFDFELGIAAKDIAELDLLITKIVDDISEIQEYEIMILSRNFATRAFPRKFLDISPETIAEKKNQKILIDKIDLKIINILSEKAQTPLYKIAETVNLSADAITYRLKKLKESGIIIKCQPAINYSALGYTVYTVFVNIHNLGFKKEKILEYFLNTNKNVLWAVKTIGRYNLLMYVCVEKTDEIHETMMELRELFPSEVKDYETLIAYEEYKYTYLPSICIEK
jgi:Lrp/AsnC family transcriptional regulator, regulator for asnA, asnC and gidA